MLIDTNNYLISQKHNEINLQRNLNAIALTAKMEEMCFMVNVNLIKRKIYLNLDDKVKSFSASLGL